MVGGSASDQHEDGLTAVLPQQSLRFEEVLESLVGTPEPEEADVPRARVEAKRRFALIEPRLRPSRRVSGGNAPDHAAARLGCPPWQRALKTTQQVGVGDDDPVGGCEQAQQPGVGEHARVFHPEAEKGHNERPPRDELQEEGQMVRVGVVAQERIRINQVDQVDAAVPQGVSHGGQVAAERSAQRPAAHDRFDPHAGFGVWRRPIGAARHDGGDVQPAVHQALGEVPQEVASAIASAWRVGGVVAIHEGDPWSLRVGCQGHLDSIGFTGNWRAEWHNRRPLSSRPKCRAGRRARDHESDDE